MFIWIFLSINLTFHVTCMSVYFMFYVCLHLILTTFSICLFFFTIILIIKKYKICSLRCLCCVLFREEKKFFLTLFEPYLFIYLMLLTNMHNQCYARKKKIKAKMFSLTKKSLWKFSLFNIKYFFIYLIFDRKVNSLICLQKGIIMKIFLILILLFLQKLLVVLAKFKAECKYIYEKSENVGMGLCLQI